MYFIHYFYVTVTDAAPKCPRAESPASSWPCAELSRHRVDGAESAAPSCPIPVVERRLRPPSTISFHCTRWQSQTVWRLVANELEIYHHLLQQGTCWLPTSRAISRGVHGDGDSGNPAESAGVGMNVAGIRRGLIWQLRDSRGDGFYYRGNPVLNHLCIELITIALTRIDTCESVIYAFNFSHFIK